VQLGRSGKGARGAAKAKGKGKAKAKAKAKGVPKPASMPAKPQTALILFQKAEGPFKGGLAGMSKRWSELSNEDKKKYEDQAAAARAAHGQAMATWAATAEGKKHRAAEEALKRKAAETRAKAKYLGAEGAPQCPRKPKDAQHVFLEAKRQELLEKEPGLGARELARRLAELWKGLDGEARKPFEAKAKSLLDVYEFDLQAYKDTPAYKKYEKAIGKGKKDKGRGRGGGKQVKAGGRGAKRQKKGDEDEMGFDSSDSDMLGSDSDESDSIAKLIKMAG